MPLRVTRRALLAATLALLFLPGARVVAQASIESASASPSPMTGAPAFVDSVRRVRDTLALLRGLDAIGREPGGSTSTERAWRESRQGRLLLRVGELGEGRARLDEAIRHFDEAIHRDKSVADPWVGLAEAKLLLERRHAVVKESMHQAAGTYHEDAALQHLLIALRLQPTYPAAVALLAHLLVDFDAPALPDELVEGLRLAAAHAENGPLPQLLLGRWLRKPQRFLAPPALDSAAAAFRRYVALGGDRGLAELELARVAYKQGRPDSAVALYLAGAAHGDTLARAALRRDLTWVADSAALARFDRAPADSVGAWVRQFWAERDAEAVRPEGDRLREHLRRWWYVQEHFALVNRRKRMRFGWGTREPGPLLTAQNEGLGVWALFTPGMLPESDPRSLGVDDRGLVYMRHGEPLARAASDSGNPNETWQYALPTGPILLHFFGMAAPTTLSWLMPLSPEFLGARAGLDTRFAKLELELQNSALAADLQRRLARQKQIFYGEGPGALASSAGIRFDQITLKRLLDFNQASIKRALTTDTYPLTYEHDLEPTVQIYALGDERGGASRAGRALVVFAVRGDRLRPEVRDGRVVYPLRLRVTAVDTAQDITRSADTLRLFATRDTLAKGQYLYGTVELPLPAGSYYVRALVEEPARKAAGAVGRADVEVPGAPGRLTASDLVTGSRTSGLAWTHGGRRIALDPLDTYRPGGALELYYELGGTRAGGKYWTTVELARLGGGGGKGKDHVSLGFTDLAEGSALAVQRTLALDGLAPGRYLLTLTVQEDGSGRALTRERIVNVVGR